MNGYKGGHRPILRLCAKALREQRRALHEIM
jgi:hypothetical protein